MDDHATMAYIGVGANLGDRQSTLWSAVHALDEHEGIAVDFDGGIASLYETSPVGVSDGELGLPAPIDLSAALRASSPPQLQPSPTSDQPDYLNSVVSARCTLAPRELLDVLLSIERAHGRTRTHRFAARTLDLDLLLFGDTRMHDKSLTLPHPRMHERRFVLEPLAEIAGDVIHPELNVTIGELATRCRDTQSVERVMCVRDRRWIIKPRSGARDVR